MNKLKLLAALTIGLTSAVCGAADSNTAPASAPAAAAQQTVVDSIVAVVNRDVITERELQERTHVVALNLRRQNIQLPPMDQLRTQVLNRLIDERIIMQRARETGIRIDDQIVNASIEQIAAQNNITVEQLRQRLQADGVPFNAFREEIRDEITTQRLREREVDAKIIIPESEIDAYLAEQAGFNGTDSTQYHMANILLPIEAGQNPDEVKKKAEEVAARARAGEDFATLAATYSQGDNALAGGDMGWRDTTRIPAEFLAEMKDSTQNGTVYVGRTDQAFHVFKLIGKRDGIQAQLSGGPVEQTHARHILMNVSDLTPEAEVIKRLTDIRRRILAGEADFATMARLNSVDNSATRGGDLGWLQAGDTVPAFEDAMKALKPGEISAPVKSQFGYHLIQVVDRRQEADGNPQRLRMSARTALRERKLAEAAFNWQREMRDQAYIEIRNNKEL